MPGPRVLISTDIGGMDNDDAQSLIHALHYANDVNYVGIVNTRTDDGGMVAGRPRDGMKMIDEIINAYARDLPNLRAVDSDYPTADALRNVVRKGAFDGRFPGQLSDGAKLIVSEARKASADDPLYVLTWGPIHDAAAALLSAPDIVPNVRLFSIAGWAQDKRNTNAYDSLVRAVSQNDAYNDLWWIDSKQAFQGFYLKETGGKSAGINATLPWIKEHAQDAGHLGDLLHDKYAYDVHTWEHSRTSPDGLKMGDTPSLLYLLDAVNNDQPGASSWGGTFVRTGLGTQTWGDSPAARDRIGGVDGAGSIAKHRRAFLDDYAERLEWAETGRGVSQPDPRPRPDPIPRPDPQPPEGDLDVASPDAAGLVRFGGGKIKSATVTEIRDFDFADGDRIVFVNYDQGTFKAVNGGNFLNVGASGAYAQVDSLADLAELIGASAKVDARVDLPRDMLVLEIDKASGEHEVALSGYGRAFAAAFDSLL